MLKNQHVSRPDLEIATNVLSSARAKNAGHGQLAGGVAHDFNNVLTAIIGYSDLLLANHRPTDPSFQDIMQIKQNANRAARCLDGRVVVTCVKGSVEVVCDRRLIMLGSDQQTAFATAGPGFKEVVDPAVVTSWERGFLIFRNAPLADVVREINRYRRGYIVVTNDALGRRMVNATFHVNQLDNFFVQVHKTLNAQILEMPLGVTFLS